jgi:hypothetical protein
MEEVFQEYFERWRKPKFLAIDLLSDAGCPTSYAHLTIEAIFG